MSAKPSLLIGLMWIAGCGSAGERSAVEELDYGKEAFVAIYDQQGDGYELGGAIPVRAGMVDAFAPGAVVVVAKEGGVELKGKHYEDRSILLIDSKKNFLVAPPGHTGWLPEDMELFGRQRRQGEFLVPSDSKMPQ